MGLKKKLLTGLVVGGVGYAVGRELGVFNRASSHGGHYPFHSHRRERFDRYGPTRHPFANRSFNDPLFSRQHAAAYERYMGQYYGQPYGHQRGQLPREFRYYVTRDRSADRYAMGHHHRPGSTYRGIETGGFQFGNIPIIGDLLRAVGIIGPDGGAPSVAQPQQRTPAAPQVPAAAGAQTQTIQI